MSENRTRTSSYSAPAVTKTVTVNFVSEVNPDDSYTTLNQRDFIPKTTFNEMVDVVTPDFYAKSRRGEIINNPMSKIDIVEHLTCFERDRIVTHSINADNEETYTHATGSSPYTMTYKEPSDFQSRKERCIDLAVTSANAGVSVSKAAALVTLGEAKESLNSMASVLRNVAKFCHILRKKRIDLFIKEVKNQLSPDELMDTWMFIRYAIRPMIYDTMDIIEALKADVTIGQRCTSRGYSHDSEDDSDVFTSRIISSLADFTSERKYDWTFEARAGVLFEVERAGLLELWGFTQPTEAVFDLITLSFVLNWIINISDLISAWTPESGLKTLASWVKTDEVLTQVTEGGDLTILNNDLDVYPRLTGTFTAGTQIKVTKTEERLVTPPLPMMPRLNVNLDAMKLTDLAIIVRNLVLACCGKGGRMSDLRI